MKSFFITAFAAVSATLFSSCNCQDGLKTIVIDGAEVTWISDNAEPKFMVRELFPQASDSLINALGLKNGIPSSISAFLVRKDGETMLFDAGMGADDSRLPAALETLGVSPADIDFIFLTHLHGDHIGGLTKDEKAVFPNAAIYVSEVEYNGWMAMPTEQNAQAAATLAAYEDRLRIFSEDTGLPCRVKQVEAYGHTPGHTLYRIGELLIVGDIVHGTALQLAYPEICANFDMDKQAAVSSRTRILDYVRENRLTMAGMHFPKPGFISYKELPADKNTKKETDMNKNETIEKLKTRRAIRSYQSTVPDMELLKQVLEAGTYAPTGMGRQAPIIIAVTDKAVRDRLSQLNAAVMGTENDPFYGAPVVFVVLADRNIPTYLYDGSLVMGNLMNAAHAVGLGSCWIHRAKEVFDSEEGKAMLEEWGIKGDYEGIGNCIIGYPAQPAPQPKPRKEDYVHWIK